MQGFTEEEEMYRIIFQMLFWLGCRVGELLALTSENLSDYGQGNRERQLDGHENGKRILQRAE